MSESDSSQGVGSGAGPVPTTAEEAILWTDGAARGNPGPAGCGAILKTADGRVLSAESQYLGQTTNNVAEYKALLLGLTRALEAGVRRIEVRADSELLIRQLKGEYRVKNEGLKPLAAEAKALLARFESFRLQHVRRELNTEADQLANEGIDRGSAPSSSAPSSGRARASSTSKSGDK
nr:MAG: ribonuclease H [Pseudomonadota bacterium]